MRYTAAEVGKMMGRLAETINQWAKDHEIGTWADGEQHITLIRGDDVPKVAKRLGVSMPAEIPPIEGRSFIEYEIPDGYVTVSQIRKALGSRMPIRQAIRDLDLASRHKAKTKKLFMSKGNVKALAKACRLPDPFVEPHEPGTNSPPPAGMMTALDIAATAGITNRRVVAMLRRHNRGIVDPTKKNRHVTTQKDFEVIAELEKMPNPFNGDAIKSLDSSGKPWTRYEDGSRRIFVALVHDGRGNQGDEVPQGWWCWEITPTDEFIIHAREYRSRQLCLSDALRRMKMDIKDLKLASDPLDSIRLKAWNFRISHDGVAEQLGISARVARRFLYGWPVRRPAEESIVESMRASRGV
ncbi:hypothetical protein EC9_45290 [Rosistilla ulvae]|uniref:Uncharacterized protein n=1 Tax=Rosistilla ulvae TaxID=1930277 RepID=A0A517M621_9BACT|nr:hypothetical protein [Rosistilla ulvae]QDS90322.1 hypothetical protein EC9_45290 [Rosistilla ulvae]